MGDSCDSREAPGYIPGRHAAKTRIFNAEDLHYPRVVEKPSFVLSPVVSRDALSALQLRVAQRADEIARERTRHTALDLECWLIAEAEIFRDASLLDRQPLLS